MSKFFNFNPNLFVSQVLWMANFQAASDICNEAKVETVKLLNQRDWKGNR